MGKENHPVVDWDDMSEVDRVKAMDLLCELNTLFDKYDPSKEINFEEIPLSEE